jgi:hypothetical protein
MYSPGAQVRGVTTFDYEPSCEIEGDRQGDTNCGDTFDGRLLVLALQATLV